MKLSDIQIFASAENTLKGHVHGLTKNYTYEIYGPFGQGYNIRVEGDGTAAVLNYHWRDGGCSEVKAVGRRYSITEQIICNSSGVAILHLRNDELISEIQELVLLAIFAVNHYYAKRSGHFQH